MGLKNLPALWNSEVSAFGSFFKVLYLMGLQLGLHQVAVQVRWPLYWEVSVKEGSTVHH